MLSDAICCKLTSWPESYPTSHAVRLRHTREVSWGDILFLSAILQFYSFVGIKHRREMLYQIKTTVYFHIAGTEGEVT